MREVLRLHTTQTCNDERQCCVQTNQICNVIGSRTNNRPIQPINGRIISLGKVSTANT